MEEDECEAAAAVLRFFYTSQLAAAPQGGTSAAFLLQMMKVSSVSECYGSTLFNERHMQCYVRAPSILLLASVVRWWLHHMYRRRRGIANCSMCILQHVLTSETLGLLTFCM